MTGPTDQRHRLFEAEALLQHPRQQQPPQPRTRPVMQQQQPSPPPPPQQQQLTMMLPPPQGFLGAGTGMPPQGAGGFGAVTVSLAEAEAAARVRAAEQMAFEDAWKVLHPDFRTPFTSVEDAVSRCAAHAIPSSTALSCRRLIFTRFRASLSSSVRAWIWRPKVSCWF